jgi:hypothetical protein
MDDSVLALLSFVVVFVLLDVAALRFAVDSRRLTRELPLPGEPAVPMHPVISRSEHALPTLEASRQQARPAWMMFARRKTAPGLASLPHTLDPRNGLA